MKRLFASLLGLTLLAGAACAEPLALPKEFYVTQHWISWTMSFDIETPVQKLGTVHRRFWSLRPQYDFYDAKEALQATAHMRWFSFGPIFDVVNAKEEPLGRVEERIFTFFPTFDLIANDGRIMAVASLNFWGTTYSLVDPLSGEEMATLHRSFIRLKDNWTVTITKHELLEKNKISPELFITVMAFQTDHDNWKRNDQICAASDFNGVLKKVSRYYETTVSDPSEEDFQTITRLVESIVSEKMDVTSVTKENEDEIGAEMMAALDSLKTNPSLTPSQKEAAYILFTEKLSQLERSGSVDCVRSCDQRD